MFEGGGTDCDFYNVSEPDGFFEYEAVIEVKGFYVVLFA